MKHSNGTAQTCTGAYHTPATIAARIRSNWAGTIIGIQFQRHTCGTVQLYDAVTRKSITLTPATRGELTAAIASLV